MSHVDEGLLHAWLDGALQTGDAGEAREIEDHLAHCADCRARLEEARRLKATTDSILALTEPADLGNVPPFEEILARKAAEGDDAPATTGTGSDAAPDGGAISFPHPPRRRAITPLAWAASLVLAIGAGWWARQLTGPALGTAVYELTAVEPEMADSEALAPAPRAPAAPADAAVAARESTAAPAPAATTPAAPEPAPAAKSRSTRQRSAPAHEAESTTVLAAKEQAASGARARAPVQGPREDTIEPAVPAPTAERHDPVDEITIAPSFFADRSAERLAAARADSPVTARAEAVATVSDPGWHTVDRAEAERSIGWPIAVVPDLPVLEIAMGEEGDAIRVRQRLEGGEILELVQRREALALNELVVTGIENKKARSTQPTDTAVQAPAPAAVVVPRRAAEDRADTDDVTTVEVRRLGYTITARAPLPPDSLRTLLRQVP